MLTYDLTKTDGPLYKCLYECIKNDISQGKLGSGEKMPSKRTLAKNLGVSTITVENAYDQLIGEGYMFARPKKGYFIADVSDIRVIKAPVHKELSIKLPPEQDESIFDFSSNRTDSGNFPFSIWAKLMRETISLREQELLSVSPCGGVRELREAIASHLSSFRGMNVDPDQIIVGAGTEYLYGLLVKLLGTDKVYCVEDPGYKKISQIYECNNAKCLPVQMDEQGISVELIKKANAQIAHISPTHHFPTGITMPVNRRYELLAWANESSDRYIIEDDYDSEFRYRGKPIPALQGMDRNGRVIYLGTFSKCIAPAIRVSYLVLPPSLLVRYRSQTSFYASTVSRIDQNILYQFLSGGHFERHLNRMRAIYKTKHDLLLEQVEPLRKQFEIRGEHAGLHILLTSRNGVPEEALIRKAAEAGVRVYGLNSYFIYPEHNHRPSTVVLGYASLSEEQIVDGIHLLKTCWGIQNADFSET